MRRVLSSGWAFGFTLVAGAGTAFADDLRAHATLGVAHAVTSPQDREFGWGGAGTASLELPLGSKLGFEAKLGGVFLSKGEAPRDPSFARRSTGLAMYETLGLRARPFTDVAGPWASAGAGALETGRLFRFAFAAAVGWDFRLSRTSRWDLGPVVEYVQAVEPNDSLRPEDARLLFVGVHVGLGVDEKTPERGDRDRDAVYDDEDACPDVAGIRTEDPKTNGCPRADRDQDTVYDDEDACPDIKGVRTDRPETNGCPVQERIHVERDRIMLDDVILFDLDSPRVRHASWPVIERLAEFISATPDILEISIEGHTDATGDEAHNMTLSKDRAESVRKLLVRYGVDPSRVKAEAFGRSRLVVQTSGPERKNRRVEFWITRAREQAPVNFTPTSPGVRPVDESGGEKER